MSDAVGVFHWIWIAIMLVGIPLQFIFPWYIPIHWAIMIATLLSQIIWAGCPLVALQQALRAKYDPNTCYYGSFVYHGLKKIGITVPPIIIASQMIIFIIVSLIVVLVFKTPS